MQATFILYTIYWTYYTWLCARYFSTSGHLFHLMNSRAFTKSKVAHDCSTVYITLKPRPIVYNILAAFFLQDDGIALAFQTVPLRLRKARAIYRMTSWHALPTWHLINEITERVSEGRKTWQVKQNNGLSWHLKETAAATTKHVGECISWEVN